MKYIGGAIAVLSGTLIISAICGGPVWLFWKLTTITLGECAIIPAELTYLQAAYLTIPFALLVQFSQTKNELYES